MNEIETIIAQTIEILSKRTFTGPKWPTATRPYFATGGGAWGRAVLEKCGERCVRCGSTERLQAHHIHRFADAPQLAGDVNNGVALCKECHRHAHRTGEYCAPGTPKWASAKGTDTGIRKQPQLPL